MRYGPYRTEVTLASVYAGYSGVTLSLAFPLQEMVPAFWSLILCWTGTLGCRKSNQSNQGKDGTAESIATTGNQSSSSGNAWLCSCLLAYDLTFKITEKVLYHAIPVNRCALCYVLAARLLCFESH